jgi:hypothetical protein
MKLATIRDRAVRQAFSAPVLSGCRKTTESLLRTTPERAGRIMREDLEMLSCGIQNLLRDSCSPACFR